MKTNKKTITVDGVTYNIVRPNAKQNSDAQIESNKAFAEAVAKKAPPRSKLRQIMEDAGVWSKDDDKKVKDLQDKLFDAEKKLARGAKSGLNKSEARKSALDMRVWRNDLLSLRLREIEYDNRSAESIADNAKFDYLVSVCTLDAEGNKVFSSLDDYYDKADEKYASECAKTLSEILYSDIDFAKDLPETNFLKKYKFADDKGRLINEKGKLIDSEGRLINEDGYYVDEYGARVDRDGNLLDDKGNIVADDFEEFKD